jgi:hypothetical protein
MSSAHGLASRRPDGFRDTLSQRPFISHSPYTNDPDEAHTNAGELAYMLASSPTRGMLHEQNAEWALKRRGGSGIGATTMTQGCIGTTRVPADLLYAA